MIGLRSFVSVELVSHKYVRKLGRKFKIFLSNSLITSPTFLWLHLLRFLSQAYKSTFSK
jgi:hypothetical protein